MDTEIKVIEVIPKVSCGPAIIQEDDPFTFCAERVYQISDDELSRLGQRFSELMESHIEEDIERGQITRYTAPHYISKYHYQHFQLKRKVDKIEADLSALREDVDKLVSVVEQTANLLGMITSKIKGE